MDSLHQHLEVLHSFCCNKYPHKLSSFFKKVNSKIEFYFQEKKRLYQFNQRWYINEFQTPQWSNTTVSYLKYFNI